MNDFIQKNKRLLNLYQNVARIAGWVLIALSPIGTVLILSGKAFTTENILTILYILQSITLNPIILGLLLIGTSQFIRCLSGIDYKPGWVLKNGSTVLYAAAFIILMSCFMNYLFFSFVSYSIETVKISNIITFFIPAVTKILIMIGLGKILTRILPVIEESKTLV